MRSRILGMSKSYSGKVTEPLSTLFLVDAADLEQPTKNRQFRKFTYRGVDLEQLLAMNQTQVSALLPCRARRALLRGSHQKSSLLRKLKIAKKDAGPEKPEVVRTQRRSTIIVPAMIGSVIGVHNGRDHQQVEIKPNMLGSKLADFSLSYRPVKHGRPGIGATHSSRFIPLK